MQVGPYRINCTVASLGYNHLSLLIFTKLALTYFASVVKSNFGNFGVCPSWVRPWIQHTYITVLLFVAMFHVSVTFFEDQRENFCRFLKQWSDH